jgi:LPS-assembly lipoprotein
MIARRRLLAFFVLPATLGGCGWEPLYANHDSPVASADLRAIKVAPIPERVGQWLETGLRNSFNPDQVPTKPAYTLAVSLSTSLSNIGIQSQGLGTRGEVQITASYRLINNGNGSVVQTGSVHTSDSFDIQANGYSTVVAQDDARRRDVEEIRREIVARLTLYMQNKQPVAS